MPIKSALRNAFRPDHLVRITVRVPELSACKPAMKALLASTLLALSVAGWSQSPLPDPKLLPQPPEPLQVPVLLSRPLLPTVPRFSAEIPASHAWTPGGEPLRRVSATFFFHGMEWVTPREKLQKFMRRSCPG